MQEAICKTLKTKDARNADVTACGKPTGFCCQLGRGRFVAVLFSRLCKSILRVFVFRLLPRRDFELKTIKTGAFFTELVGGWGRKGKGGGEPEHRRFIRASWINSFYFINYYYIAGLHCTRIFNFTFHASTIVFQTPISSPFIAITLIS